jgi:antibiotic biosynthesis monooxygenase (ABM) superfamily enzyme
MNKNTQHKRAFLIWLAIYPLIAIIFMVFGGYLAKFPVPLRTLMLTVIVVPLMVYIILPFYYKVFGKWLND